jgi:leader peptidase (prepilin peptidase)/N-methyltransferase
MVRMVGNIILACIVSFIISILLRTSLISFRKNIQVNEEYLRYHEEHEGDQSNFAEVPEAYLFDDKYFLKEFSVRASTVMEVINSAEFYLIWLINTTMMTLTITRIDPVANILVTSIVLEILLLISIVDVQYGLIPDSAHIVIMLGAVLSMFFPNSISMVSRLVGFLIGGGFLWILYMMGGMGGGDVKLMAVAGFWLGFPKIILALMIGIFCAAVISLLLIALGRKKRKDSIAFGPFLAFGIVATMLLYTELINLFI